MIRYSVTNRVKYFLIIIAIWDANITSIANMRGGESYCSLEGVMKYSTMINAMYLQWYMNHRSRNLLHRILFHSNILLVAGWDRTESESEVL